MMRKSGQLERFINHYLTTYRRHFEKIYIFTYQTGEKLAIPGVEVITPPFALNRFLYAFTIAFRHRQIIKQCDLLRGMHISSVLSFLPAKLFLGKKIVFTYGYREDKFLLVEKKYWRWLFFKIMEFSALKLADAVIVTFNKMHVYVSKFRQKNVFLIPNGADTKQFKVQKSKVMGDKKKMRILFIGRLERQKNLFALIGAVYLLRNNNLLLWFLGEGSQREKLKEYARRKNVNLKIDAFLPYEKLPEIYRRADIFVLPSLIEGHSKVLLEAQACGLPCIATKVEGSEEIITHGENGFLAEPTSKDIAEKLSWLLADKSLMIKLGQQARKIMLKNYDLTRLLLKEVLLLKTSI